MNTIIRLKSKITFQKVYREKINFRPISHRQKTEIDPYLDSEKRIRRVNFREHKKIFDKEYLGALEGKIEGEDWEDVIIDRPLDTNPKFKYNLRLMGPAPKGFTKHLCWIEGNEIMCANPLTKKIETIDAENEVWIEKQDPRKFPNFRGKTQLFGDIDENYFFIWDRTSPEKPGIIRVYDKETMKLSGTDVTVFPLPEDYYYAKLFSVKKQLIMQSRMRPVRDVIGNPLYALAEYDVDLVHKETATRHKVKYYKIESMFSHLFYYNFDQKEWFQIQDAKFMSCSMIVKSKDEKHVYFLSKLNQGYVLDTDTWRVSPLHLIGRPGNISEGCTGVHIDNKIVTVGGGWPELDTQVTLAGGISVRGKIKNISKEIFKFSPRILLLDLKTKRWCVPVIESDSMDQWEPIAYAACIPYKNKIFIIGGENKRGETRKVWVLEEMPGKKVKKLRKKKKTFKSKENEEENKENGENEENQKKRNFE